MLFQIGTHIELGLGMVIFEAFLKTWDHVGLQAAVDLDLGPGASIQPPLFVHPQIEVGTIAGTLRVDGEELACWVGDLFLCARLVGDQFVLSGGYWGEHAIDAHGAITGPDRLIAHWRGYCDNNVRLHLETGGSL